MGRPCEHMEILVCWHVVVHDNVVDYSVLEKPKLAGIYLN